MAHRGRRVAGFTLLELTLVVALTGMLTVVALRQLHRHLDRMATRGAVGAAALLVARAREEALARRATVTLHVDTAAGIVTLNTLGTRIARSALGHEHGVTLATTRDSIHFDVRGLGRGAANTTLVARRGRSADTLVVSRLGRTRH